MTNIIAKRPVVLTVEEVERLLPLLRDLSRADFEHARKTKSAAVRAYAETRANTANDLEDALVRRLYGHGLRPVDETWLAEIEAQADSTVPHYVPYLVAEIRRLHATTTIPTQEEPRS